MKAPTRRIAALVGLMGLVAVPASSTLAQDAGELDPALVQESREHFERGTRAFDVGDWDTAVTEFNAAYELTHHPDLLYNVYSAEERNGNLEDAAEALEGYLRDGSPDEPRRADLEARLARMRERLAERRAEAAEARAAEAERAAAEAGDVDGAGTGTGTGAGTGAGADGDGGVHPAAIASFVIAGVGLVSFAVFAALSEVEDSHLTDTCGTSCDDVSALTAYNVTADVSWITAAVAATLGLVFLFTLEEGGDGDSASATLLPWASPTGAGAAIGGRF